MPDEIHYPVTVKAAFALNPKWEARATTDDELKTAIAEAIRRSPTGEAVVIANL